MHLRVRFFLPLSFLIMISVACEKDKVPPDYLALHEIKSTHHFNESPCPQKLGETKVNCNNTVDPGCTADSAFVVNDHPHLWNAFTGDVYGIALSETSEVSLAIWFNCRAANDIKHNIEVRFYHSGGQVDTEFLAVDLKYEK